MALTGLQIYKLLPRTNCGDCNFPTCMAFAMAVATKRVALDQCPHVSDEARSALAEASEPPMKLVSIGTGDKKIDIGQETVLFRHEERFQHEAGVAVLFEDNLSDAELEKKVEEIKKLKFLRVGEEIGVNLVALKHNIADAETYASISKKLSESTDLPLILMSDDPSVIEASLKAIGDEKPLIYAANKSNFEKMANMAKQFGCPLSVYSEKLEELADLTQDIKKLGVDNLVIDPGVRQAPHIIDQLTRLRRLAVQKVFRPLGYPVIMFVDEEEPYQETIQATQCMCKYANLIVMRGTNPWQLLPLLTVRQNIYTDPQVPNAIEDKLYEIGTVTPDSPVLVTTNFSLTYFTVESEVENSKIPSYISVVETEGMGVLNAYAGDKWSAEKIAKFLEKQKVREKVNHNTIIIPGLVAVFRAELIDEYEWNVIVGPEEAARIPSFLRNEWKPGVSK
ncbi:MAG: acetyl-CoA decarbonylase/synthase complex subunit gamma [Spirochaetes bacterium]|nr:MAG: acetyl-CoA decarbonylase/synthase complex subunit gamma [Spirochaetota bacterium]RKY03562.1 MAG: acetyl-CoA decarbonylase/synthase complex subunit gamma [Spirochaetota bacterium]